MPTVDFIVRYMSGKHQDLATRVRNVQAQCALFRYLVPLLFFVGP